MAKHWIQKAGIESGGLHESLGIPGDKKIGTAKIEAATHSDNPTIRKQAVLARTFAHIRSGKHSDFAHHPHGRSTAHSTV
jgi:hypothetical protein